MRHALVDIVAASAVVLALALYYSQPLYVFAFIAVSVSIALIAKMIALARSTPLMSWDFALLWALTLCVYLAVELGVRIKHVDADRGQHGALPLAVDRIRNGPGESKEIGEANQKILRAMASLINTQRCTLRDRERAATAQSWTTVLMDHDVQDVRENRKASGRLFEYYKLKTLEVDSQRSYVNQGMTLVSLLATPARRRIEPVFVDGQKSGIKALEDILESQRRQITVMEKMLDIQFSAAWSREFKKPVEDTDERMHELESELVTQRQAYVPYVAYQMQLADAANEKLNGILRQAYPELSIHGGDCNDRIPLLH